MLVISGFFFRIWKICVNKAGRFFVKMYLFVNMFYSIFFKDLFMEEIFYFSVGEK